MQVAGQQQDSVKNDFKQKAIRLSKRQDWPDWSKVGEWFVNLTIRTKRTTTHEIAFFHPPSHLERMCLARIVPVLWKSHPDCTLAGDDQASLSPNGSWIAQCHFASADALTLHRPLGIHHWWPCGPTVACKHTTASHPEHDTVKQWPSVSHVSFRWLICKWFGVILVCVAVNQINSVPRCIVHASTQGFLAVLPWEVVATKISMVCLSVVTCDWFMVRGIC